MASSAVAVRLPMRWWLDTWIKVFHGRDETKASPGGMKVLLFKASGYDSISRPNTYLHVMTDADAVGQSPWYSQIASSAPGFRSRPGSRSPSRV